MSDFLIVRSQHNLLVSAMLHGAARVVAEMVYVAA